VLVGARLGAYPYANSLLVRGATASLVVDPSLSLVGTAPPADLVLVSHAHEDHIAGLGSYDVPVHIHEDDLPALRSRAALIAGYGLPPDEADATVRDHFHVRGRPDATASRKGPCPTSAGAP
jgi:glyoxylase-like metal-dependent hydrolase (beta-lactamase superfamily II)